MVAVTRVGLFTFNIFQNSSLGFGSSSMLSHGKNFVFRKHTGHTRYFNAFLGQISNLLSDWTTVYQLTCFCNDRSSKFKQLVRNYLYAMPFC